MFSCISCGAEMDRLLPIPVYDPQPTSYRYEYQCENPECAAIYSEDRLLRYERELSKLQSVEWSEI